LLGFDGRIHHLEKGYWLKFEIERVATTPRRPHGAALRIHLARPRRQERLVGFDNAHAVGPLGSRFRRPGVEHDHWHRTGNDPGRPYAFTNAAQLVTDFFAEVRRVLAEHGIDDTVIGESGTSDRRKR
jgi:hypothetical protein